jgi:hypothetical protein
MEETVELTVRDMNPAGRVLQAFLIRMIITGNAVTLRDIIRSRVASEVDQYNKGIDDRYRGLVIPQDAENTLNGFKLNKRRKIDAGAQFRIACEAFDRNGFFVLIDGRQAESLDALYVIGKNTEISFVRLIPLQGG